MRDYFKPKTWLITTLMAVVAFGLSSAAVYYEFGLKKNIKITSASADNNVSGWAWNSNIGWISFNCTDVPKSCSGGANSGKSCLNDGECTGGSCVNGCLALSNYGVSIDSITGNFSGYAWSSSVGWISFNRADAGNPPGQPYQNGGGNDPIARYNRVNGQVDGWAKILSLGDNGWVKLWKFSSDSGPDYGVSIAGGNFSGWAWNANSDGSGIGWISFNCLNVPKSCNGGANNGKPCLNDGECAGGSCVETCAALSNYKVVANINSPPAAANLTAPNWSYADAAGTLGALNARPGWTFSDSDSGSSESAYQIIINTRNNINGPVFDSGKCLDYNNPTNKCKVGHGPTGTTLFTLAAADGLNYGTAYYWWIKVWDEHGIPSNSDNFTQYNTNPDTDNDDGPPDNKTFTTYMHEFPRPRASWFPASPSQGEEVKFSATSSQRFFSVPLPEAPYTPVNCQENKCDWLWTTNNVNDDIKSPNASTTVIIFNSSGVNFVKLRVTDETDTGNIPYYGEKNLEINVNAKLPMWKEVKPE